MLWLGRNQRLGNRAQRPAATVRDKGCVRCDAPVHRTELHHLRDWYDGGPIDIDNLVSLCGPHHRELREHNRELVKLETSGKPVPAPDRPRRLPPRAARPNPPSAPGRLDGPPVPTNAPPASPTGKSVSAGSRIWDLCEGKRRAPRPTYRPDSRRERAWVMSFLIWAMRAGALGKVFSGRSRETKRTVTSHP